MRQRSHRMLGLIGAIGVATIVAVVSSGSAAQAAMNLDSARQLPSSRPAIDPAVPRVSWDAAKVIVNSGMVLAVSQTHAFEVQLSLKGGGSLATTEPRIDEVFRVIEACGMPCKNIAMITE